MTPALILGGLLLGGLAASLLATWAQRRGWINLRAAGGGVTAGLAQAGQFVDPPARHVVQVKEQKPADHRDGDDR